MTDLVKRIQRNSILQSGRLLLAGALLFVVGLAWNSLFQDLFDNVIRPRVSGLIAQIIYTIVLTVVLILIIVNLSDEEAISSGELFQADAKPIEDAWAKLYELKPRYHIPFLHQDVGDNSKQW
jgi:uncharacterized membrane protein